MDIYGAALSLFLVYNVLGTLPFYIAILKPYPPKRQKYILIREMLIALFILFLFGFFGENVLKVLGLSMGTLGISGGILLFLISLSMIFPKQSEVNGNPGNEPFIIPIATPNMAGPGSITAVMVFSQTFTHSWEIFLIIFLAWIPSLIILLAASNIRYLVGERGLVAFERLGGLLISLIAIQMISSGVVKLVKQNFPSTVTEQQVTQE